MEMRHSRIAWRYMRGWFLFDVISSLPWEQMMSQSSHIPTTSIVALLKVRWHAGITSVCWHFPASGSPGITVALQAVGLQL